MRTVLNLIVFHIQRLLKTPAKLGMLVLMPVCIVGLFIFLNGNSQNQSSDNYHETSNLIILGHGNEDLMENLQDYGLEKAIQDDRKASLNAVKSGKASILYVFPTNYFNRIEQGERVSVTIYRRDAKATWPLLDQILQKITYRHSLKGQLQTHGIESNFVDTPLKTQIQLVRQNQVLEDMDGMTYLILLVVYILIGGVSVGYDLVAFKKERSLRRSLVAPLESWKITFAYLSAYAGFMFLVNACFIIFLKFYLGFSMVFFWQALLIIVLAIVWACAFGLALFRIFKEPNLCQSIGMLLWLAVLILAFISQMSSLGTLRNIGYMSPFAWMIKMLDSGQSFPGALIILLMSLVLFTAGSFKLEKYVQA